MGWDTIILKYKIKYLQQLMKNTKKGTFSKIDKYTIDALLEGSENNESFDDFNDDYMEYLQDTWERAVSNQLDDNLLNFIKKEIQKK